MTVKRNGDRVILKDGKVSCSCCEEPGECCMYPAQALADGLYSANDLPDQIVFRWREPGGPFINTVIDKSGSQYEIDVSTSFGTTTNIRVRVESNPSNPSVYFWQYQLSGPLFPSSDSGSNPCLIRGDGGLTPGNDRIEDQFADTYTVTINPPDDNAGTYTVTRRSICVWSTQVQESGEPAGLKLSYIDAVIGGGFAYTWEIELDTSYIKDGFANTPTGDYSGGNATVS